MNNDNKYVQYLSMSLAYLEIGEYSAQKNNNNGDYQNGVAYQLFHALELFVKYAILLKTRKSELKGHELGVLFKKYYKLYPEEIYHIEHPFDFSNYQATSENPNEKKLVENHLKTFELKIMDQHLRYPASAKNGGYSFKIDKSIFSEMKNRFMEIDNNLHLK